jgi:hypothetical protein
VCGYTDGPYVYTCEKGCCSEDCSATRGNLVQERIREKPTQTWIDKFEEFRKKLRITLFGPEMPTGVILVILGLVIVILLSLANMLKENKPFQRRNGN